MAEGPLRSLVTAFREAPLECREPLGVAGHSQPLVGQLLVSHPLAQVDVLKDGCRDRRICPNGKPACPAASASSQRRR